MNILLTIISLIVISFFSYSQYLKYKRFKYSINLKSTYNKMEMYFTKNRIPINKKNLQLLKTFKDLSINPDYLDIQILVMSKIATQKSGSLTKDTEWFDENLKSLGKDFKILFEEFDNSANKMIMLSIWKPDFVIFAVRLIVKRFLKTGVLSLGKIMKELAFIKKNDEAIFFSANKLDLGI